jgi:hypothetical protein
MPRILKAYMGEAVWPTKPTRGRTPWPLWVLAQRGGIVAEYGSSCYSVASTTWWSSKEGICMDKSPHLAIGYQLRENS